AGHREITVEKTAVGRPGPLAEPGRIVYLVDTRLEPDVPDIDPQQGEEKAPDRLHRGTSLLRTGACTDHGWDRTLIVIRCTPERKWPNVPTWIGQIARSDRTTTRVLCHPHLLHPDHTTAQPRRGHPNLRGTLKSRFEPVKLLTPGPQAGIMASARRRSSVG